MRSNGIKVFIAIFISLLLIAPPANSASKTQNASQNTSQASPEVIGLELLSTDKEALARIAQQGFVAKPPGSKQIYLPYLNHQLPPFITADSLLRTFQIIYEESVVNLEEANAEKLLTV